MPTIEAVCRAKKVPVKVRRALGKHLPAVAARALSCVEGGVLSPEEIMIEFSFMSRHNVNCKDIHFRVIAHNYESRLARLDEIRKTISEEVKKHLPNGVSWYVWILPAQTSYGSDTEA